MARTFEHRTRIYRASVLLLMVSAVLTAVGFGTGHWVDRGDRHYGLWVSCSSSRPDTPGSDCIDYDLPGSSGLADVFQVPRILISLEVSALLVCCVMAVVLNCRHHVPAPRNRLLEAFLAVAGFLGLTGCSLFWSHKNRVDSDQQVATMLSWSFHLVFLNSVVLLLLASLIGCNQDVEPGSDEVSLPVTLTPSLSVPEFVGCQFHGLVVEGVTMEKTKLSALGHM